MKIENQVIKNTKDIAVLQVDVKSNTEKINGLEKFIVPELKIIGKKIDKIKMPWVQYLGILAMGSFLTFVVIMIVFGGQP